MNRRVDTSEVTEQNPGDGSWAKGVRKPPLESMLRTAISAELKRRKMSRHQLWRSARRFCSTLPQSAVYEFLSGTRQIGLAYLEALLVAMELRIVRRSG